MGAIKSNRKKSVLVQIMNELDELTSEEKNFVLYWLRAKKNVSFATEANATVNSNTVTREDICEERDAMRKENLK